MDINIFVVMVVFLLIIKIVDGYKKGMVKEIISFISLIFLCLVGVLAANALGSYYDGKFLNVVVMVVFLGILGLVHHLINVAAFPAKLVAKLPVVHSVDKLLGVVVGILETLLILWTIYTFIMVADTGMVGEMILQYTAENPVLVWLYEHNQVAGWLQILGAELNARFHLNG